MQAYHWACQLAPDDPHYKAFFMVEHARMDMELMLMRQQQAERQRRWLHPAENISPGNPHAAPGLALPQPNYPPAVVAAMKHAEEAKRMNELNRANQQRMFKQFGLRRPFGT